MADNYDGQDETQGDGHGATTQEIIDQFWTTQLANIEQEHIDVKNHQLPLARVKRVMKVDEDVRNKMVRYFGHRS
jgi:hypothetical protein